EDVLQKFDTGAFFKVHRSLGRILNILDRMGLSGSCFLVEEVSTGRERVIGDMEEMRRAKPGYFSLLLVRRAR
ncbi:MAG: hypothetical protein DRG32_03075, partial [Deltaproteobacteria bacterium]